MIDILLYFSILHSYFDWRFKKSAEIKKKLNQTFCKSSNKGLRVMMLETLTYQKSVDLL